MYIWFIAAISLLLVAFIVSRKIKLGKKSKVRNALKKPAIHPAPFNIRDFEENDPRHPHQDPETRAAIDNYKSYCSTYGRLLAGDAASDIADYSRFIPDSYVPEHNADALEHFIRTAFHSDVLFGYLTLEFERNLRSALDNGMVPQWSMYPLGEAALHAFRRTGELRYLELFKQFFDRLMLLRDSKLGYHDDYHERVMDAWGAFNLGKNIGRPGLWVAHITHFAILMLPAAGFAREVLGNKDLLPYHAWAKSVIDFADEGYRAFDTDYREVGDAPERWYWRPLLEKYEATNHMHMLGQTLLSLHAVTKDEFYAERIRSFLRIFEAGVKLHDDGLASWNYSPYFQVANEKNGHISRQFSEYTWKGEYTVPFLYEAKAAGFDLRPEVLQGVTASIRDHILKDAEYKLHVHPKRSRRLAARDRKKAFFIECGISGYHVAATEDPKIEQQVIDIVARRPMLFPNGWMSQPRLSRSFARLLPVCRPDHGFASASDGTGRGS